MACMPSITDSTEDGGVEVSHSSVYDNGVNLKDEVLNAYVLGKKETRFKCFCFCLHSTQEMRIFLLITTSALASPSRIMTPIPTAFCAENTTPSTLTLNKFAGGGDQELWNSTVGVGLHMASTASVYSSKYMASQLNNSHPDFRLPPFCILFRLYHRAQAIFTTLATLSSSTLLCISICHRKSWKDTLLDKPNEATFEHSQVSRAFWQFQSTWPCVFSSFVHLSHIPSCTTFHLMRLVFIGRISLQDLQTKCQILCGTGRLHIFLQKHWTWLLSELAPMLARWEHFTANVYVLRTLNDPFGDTTQISLSCGSQELKGRLLITSVSYG